MSGQIIIWREFIWLYICVWSILLKLTWTVIYHWKRQPFFPTKGLLFLCLAHLQPCTDYSLSVAIWVTRRLGLYNGLCLNPPQRRQGPDPRALLLLLGTTSAYEPELAYRLRVAQPTFIDVPIYFWIYYYITIYVCVPHFYDLSALIGCWSSDSIRRIIYKFLNMCSFDYTAVVVSGKVERS